MGRDLLLSLSLSNLCFVHLWGELISGRLTYYAKVAPTISLWSALSNVLLLAVAFWTATRAARWADRRGHPWALALARWAFFLVVVANLRLNLLGLFLYAQARWLGLTVWLLVCAAMVTAFARWQPRILRVAQALLLILSPFLLVTLGNAVRLLVESGRASFEDPPTAAPRPVRAGAPRVVWVIFDEWDQRLTFEQRPAGVELPELDRFRRQAFFATDVYPAAQRTEASVPSILSGRSMLEVEPMGPDDLLVTFRGERDLVRWSRQPNLFSKARAAGINSAVFGWYHSYCRTLADSLTQCAWKQGSFLRGALRRDAGMLMTMRDQWRHTLNSLLSVERLGLLSRAERNREERLGHIADYRELLAIAKVGVADSTLGLTVIHLPVPHPPGIYDRRSDLFSTAESATYMDNLELVDQALGELRRALESRGMWDNTSVLLTSDHSWRPNAWRKQTYWNAAEADAARLGSDPRVPFLLHMPGQTAALTYQPAFNNLLAHDLTLALLRGEVTTAERAAQWLDARRTSVPLAPLPGE